jgi:hypothetical protein
MRQIQSVELVTHHGLVSSSVLRYVDGGVDELGVPSLEPELSLTVVGAPLV